MAKLRRPSKSAMNRLAKLSRRPESTLIGGMRQLDVYSAERAEYFKPLAAVWIEAESGYIRGSTIINPQKSADRGIGEALVSLVDALVSPMLPPSAFDSLDPNSPLLIPPRYLPGRIVLNNADLASAAREIFAPLDVRVEYSEHPPGFDEVFDSLNAHVGGDPNAAPPEPYTWDVDVELLQPLFKAAYEFYRRAPWEYMLDHPTLAIVLGDKGPEAGVETVYASILGAGGQVTGVALYFSMDDYWASVRQGTRLEAADENAMVRQLLTNLLGGGSPNGEVPPNLLGEGLILPNGLADNLDEAQSINPHNCLTYFIEFKEDADPFYLKWLKEHKFKHTRDYVPTFMRTMPDTEPRDLNEREVRAMTAALTALNAFFDQFGQDLERDGGQIRRGDEKRVTVRDGDAQAIEVQYPPEDYAWDLHEELLGTADEALPPASETAATTVYHFLVRLDWKKSVWRRIDVRADQTLDDLHEAIQEAFEWDNDHLYAFFLSGRAWDSASEYSSPFAQGRPATAFRLENLPLQAGQKILYIFDFGDELRHQITLEKIEPIGVKPGITYPHIAEVHGAPVPQY